MYTMIKEKTIIVLHCTLTDRYKLFTSDSLLFYAQDKYFLYVYIHTLADGIPFDIYTRATPIYTHTSPPAV